MQLQPPHLTTRLVNAHDLAQQLEAVLTSLEAAERATHALAELGPENTARAYLAEGGAPAPLVLAITALTDQIARTLMSAANKASAADRTAYLAAARHACLLTKALG